MESLIRNIKIDILTGVKKFPITSDAIKKNKKMLNFLLKNTSEEDVITGSLALSLYGLLDREINDIDLLIKDTDRHSEYVSSGLYGGDVICDNRLGFVEFTDRSSFFRSENYTVDYFINKGCIFDSFVYKGRKILVSSLFDIIDYKIDLDSRKHRMDLRFIKEKIYG